MTAPKEVIEELRRLSEGGSPVYKGNPNFLNYAKWACGYLRKDFNFYTSQDEIHEVCKNWKHFSGHEFVPIKSEDLTLKRDFECAWSGEYGRRRREFCGLMADYYTSQLEEEL